MSLWGGGGAGGKGLLWCLRNKEAFVRGLATDADSPQGGRTHSCLSSLALVRRHGFWPTATSGQVQS